MATQNWKTGEGYPDANSALDVWQCEFLRRGPSGLNGRPHFKLEGDRIEFFTGPAIIQIEDDGSLLCGPEATRSSVNRMVIEFQLDQDIDAQLDKARRWLTGNQTARYSVEKKRKRVTQYGHYLRAFDASTAGQSQSEIASILYPHLRDEAGKKQVSNALRAASKLISTGFPERLKRK